MTWIEIRIYILMSSKVIWRTLYYYNSIINRVTRVLVPEKKLSWIFVQKPMQMDLVQYKVLHMTYELTRIKIWDSC